MKTISIIFMIAVLLAACGKSDPPIAGKMSQSTVCSTAGYILQKNLGENFKMYQVKCTVKNVGGDDVEITSGYVSPLGPTLHYTALGTVYGNSLTIYKIKVHGIDKDFIPFSNFPS